MQFEGGEEGSDDALIYTVTDIAEDKVVVDLITPPLESPCVSTVRLRKSAPRPRKNWRTGTLTGRMVTSIKKLLKILPDGVPVPRPDTRREFLPTHQEKSCFALGRFLLRGVFQA